MHRSVMLKEAVDFLLLVDNGIYIDCNFGAGGYTKEILKRTNNTKVIGIDQDITSMNFVNEIQQKFGVDRFQFIHDNFVNIDQILANLNISKVHGLIFDLGISDMQLLENNRGFSFNSTQLDMRMDQDNIPLNATEIINTFSEQELANIIYKYGDEHKARKIARYIVNERAKNYINQAQQLADIVQKAVGKYSVHHHKIHPATKTFQAIRIFVNNELENLTRCLYKLPRLLQENGRIVIITFHSGEDRIVKSFFKEFSAPKIASSKYNKTPRQLGILENLTKKPILSSPEEIHSNYSARSAKLRAGFKTLVKID